MSLAAILAMEKEGSTTIDEKVALMTEEASTINNKRGVNDNNKRGRGDCFDN